MAPEEVHGQDFQRNRAQHFSDRPQRQNRAGLGRRAGKGPCGGGAGESHTAAAEDPVIEKILLSHLRERPAARWLERASETVGMGRRLNQQVIDQTGLADEDRK